MADMVRAFNLRDGDEIMIEYEGRMERAVTRHIEPMIVTGRMIIEMTNPNRIRVAHFDDQTMYERAP